VAQLGRPGLSWSQKAELWRRWKRGESLSDIGRALEKHAASIYGVVHSNGGFAPAERCRSGSALTLFDREDISRGIASGTSLRTIAARIGKSPSTVSREIARNGGLAKYRAAIADEKAWDRGRRPKKCRLAANPQLRKLVASKLKIDWSPQQIAGWLKTDFSNDESLQISHEAIYRTLFIQTRGALKKELVRHLRSGRTMRHSKTATNKGQTRGQIVDAISIRERPPEIADRAVPGHWEGDLISGSLNTHIATLVERHSRFTILVKIAGKDTESVVRGLTREVRKLPSALRRSLTWDRGTELANHKAFTVATNVRVYFCDPRSPWQRGTNENTNRLLRQYFPDRTDLARHSQQDLNRIALRLNQRPRKTLSYRTPAAIMSELLR
jgi:IS30 family transposase